MNARQHIWLGEEQLAELEKIASEMKGGFVSTPWLLSAAQAHFTAAIAIALTDQANPGMLGAPS